MTSPLDDLLTLLDLRHGSADVVGDEPETGSPHRLATCMAAGMAAHGAAAVELATTRGQAPRAVDVTTDDALLQLMAVLATRVGDVPVHELMEDPHLLGDSDFYRSADGREVYLLLSYPHLRDRALSVLGCPPERSAITAAVARWSAIDLETAICDARGTATMVRSAEEWAVSAAGRAIAESPVVDVHRTGDGSPRRRRDLGPDEPPLAGLRVVDLTHVIAGPVAARLTAGLGADVLHVSRPDLPDPNAMIIETGAGKRNAFCDLRENDQRAVFDALLDDADVLVHGYRDLDRFGLGPDRLAADHPGLVVADVHGWGASGPWADRGGFDQLACAATGFALEEGGDRGALPPTYLLNDYVAAFLLSAGISSALARQAKDAGSWGVHVDLARVCTWVRSFGLGPRSVGPDPRSRLAAVDLVDHPGAFGAVRTLPSLVRIDPGWSEPPMSASPLGSAPLAWW